MKAQHSVLCLLASILLTGRVGADSMLKLQGSTTVNPICAEAAEVLLKEQNLACTVDPQGGSAGGLSALGDGLVDIAMTSKPMSDKEKARYPSLTFVETAIGLDAVAIVVSRPVFDGGMTSITREQLRDLFEGKVTRWSEIGGPDLAVFVYDKEPGRGTREVFDHFVYGKEPPPLVSFRNYAQVGGNEETRTKVAAHGSAVSQLSASWVEAEKGLGALGVKLADGREVRPGEATIRDGSYPMTRRLNLVTRGAPEGGARVFIDFILSPKGQDLVKKHGYLPIATQGP